MKKFQILRYLKKYQLLIALVSLAAGISVILYAKNKQTYTAATIIEYTNEKAKEGLAPDNTKIDVSEITSSNLMRVVMDNLEVDYSQYNLDDLRSRIQVKDIISEEEKAVQEAKNEEGEVYEIYPVKYLVTFTAKNTEGKEFARRILSELMDVYTTAYGEAHVNSSAETNGTSDIFTKGYDYIEMMEVIQDSINNTMGKLSEKDTMNPKFRSNQSGYSFKDLYNEFGQLRDSMVSNVFAQILDNQVTKNKDVLLAKYQKRIDELALNQSSDSSEIESIDGIINSYVGMMKKSGNTNITYEYILDNVYDNFYTDDLGVQHGQDQTVEYDKLLKDYVANRENYEDAIIDGVYYQYIIDTYQTEKEIPVPSGMNAGVEADIKEIAERLNSLYEIAGITNSEFNEYLGAANVAVLSSIGVTEKINIWLYALLAVGLFGFLGCLGAVLLGRTGDIVDYYLYVDHSNGLPNRARCDLYIKEQDGKMLPPNFSCISVNLLDIRSYNEKYGRNKGNEVILDFSNMLRQLFEGSANSFLGYNGTGQYMIFSSGIPYSQLQHYMTRLEAAVLEYNRDHECVIRYKYGIAESENDKIYNIRALISSSVKNMGDTIWGCTPESGERYSVIAEDIYQIDENGKKERTVSGEVSADIEVSEEEVLDRMEEYYRRYCSMKEEGMGRNHEK